jgi:membrane associated rhomboid family serine protease
LVSGLGVMFAFEWRLSDRELATVLTTYGLVPAWFEWRSLLTSLFLHAGWLQVAVNMLFLWIFGGNVEDRLGHGRFALFYLLCGAAAGLGQVAAHPSSAVPVSGASGAIAGVMGAYFVLFRRSRVLTLVPSLSLFDLIEIPAAYFLAIWLLLQLVSDTAIARAHSQLALWGQIVGFGTGAALVFVLRRRERLTMDWIEQSRTGRFSR